MSAALGNAGLLIALVAASVGALATSVAIIGENRRALGGKSRAQFLGLRERFTRCADRVHET